MEAYLEKINIKIINKTIRDIPVSLRLEGDAANAGYIRLVGADNIMLKNEDQASGSFFVVLSNNFATKTKTRIKIGLYEGNKKVTTLRTNFLGPLGNF